MYNSNKNLAWPKERGKNATLVAILMGKHS